MLVRRRFLFIVLSIFVMLVISACSTPAPEVVEVEVTRIVEGETIVEEVEVTRIVEGETIVEEVEVTRVVEVEAEMAQEPVELVVWAANVWTLDDPEGAGRFLLYAKEQFEAENPGVTVVYQDQGWDESLRQNLTNSLLAGNPPDVVVGEGFFKTYAQLDALLPIDISGMEDNLIPGTYDGAFYNGQVYGLSAHTGVFGFERNCIPIEAAGFDCDTPPETWDELLAQAKAITENGNGEAFGYTVQGPAGFSLGAAFRNAVYLAQAGAPMSTPGENGLDVPNFNDPNAVPVYEFLREIEGYAPPGLAFEANEGIVYSELHQGKSAYQLAGSWHVSWGQGNGCGEECQYSTIPLPEGGQAASIVVGNVIYGALKASENPDLAVEFVKFLQRDDVQALVFDSFGFLPATRSGLAELYPNVDPATQAYIDVLTTSDNLLSMPQWEKNTQKIWTSYGDFLTKLYTTDEPVTALLDELQAEAEAALAE